VALSARTSSQRLITAHAVAHDEKMRENAPRTSSSIRHLPLPILVLSRATHESAFLRTARRRTVPSQRSWRCVETSTHVGEPRQQPCRAAAKNNAP
jgi:hypothetical protein